MLVTGAAFLRCRRGDESGMDVNTKPERTQKGNPHQLTVMQHVFPACSIARFAGADGAVSVKLRKNGKELRLPPRDQIFCADRAWNERAEASYMKEVEDNFQNLANRITDARLPICTEDFGTVTRFFALWCLRFHAKHNPIPDPTVNGIVPEGLSKDSEERLEKQWVGFIRRDQTMPGRSLTGLQIQRDIDRLAARFERSRWGVVQAGDGEFIAPDTFGTLMVVPLSPTICLVSGHEDSVVLRPEVSNLNRRAMQSAGDYFFARDFTLCPV